MWSKNTGRSDIFPLSPKKEAVHLKVRVETETRLTMITVQRFLLKRRPMSPLQFIVCYDCMHLALKVKAR